MKNIISSFLAASLLLASCNNNEKATTPESNDPTTVTKETWQPTEKYSGTVNGVEIIFEQKDYTHYRLTEEEKITEGALNTERGFEDDEDATIYILNFDKPESEQKYFVRLTDGTFAMLDAKRIKIQDSNFTKQ